MKRGTGDILGLDRASAGNSRQAVSSSVPTTGSNRPPGLASAQVWYDAAQVVGATDGAAFPNLADASGMGRDGVATGQIPWYSAGGWNSGSVTGAACLVCTNNSNYTLGGPPLTISAGQIVTVGAVFARDGENSFFAVADANSTDPQGIAIINSTAYVGDESGSTGSVAYSGTGAIFARWYRSNSGWVFRASGMSADVQILDGSGNPAAMGLILVSSIVHRLNQTTDTGYDLLAELVISSQAPTNRATWEEYTAAKWGVAL